MPIVWNKTQRSEVRLPRTWNSFFTESSIFHLTHFLDRRTYLRQWSLLSLLHYQPKYFALHELPETLLSLDLYCLCLVVFRVHLALASPVNFVSFTAHLFRGTFSKFLRFFKKATFFLTPQNKVSYASVRTSERPAQVRIHYPLSLKGVLLRLVDNIT